MKKIWKGLFYCVWHADKVPVQVELVNNLSSLLVNLSLPLSIHYFSVFLLTMRREWSGIDALRLDKFYLLIRRFMHNFFLLMKKNFWNHEVSCQLMSVLDERTFLADDKFAGNGVNYHIASVFLEELKPFLPVGTETLSILFKPFTDAMVKSVDKVLVAKIKSNMFEFLLKFGKSLLQLRKAGGDVDSEDATAVFGPIAFSLGFSAKFYNLGSSPDCLQGNRKVLFGLHEEFLELEKDLASSGIEISIPQVNEEIGQHDEVPALIPVTSDMDVSDASDVHLDPIRKSKKGKKASAGSNKKVKKKKTMKEKNSANAEENVLDVENNENSNDGNLITLDGTVISNLQRQFERVAAEVGLDKNDGVSCELLTVPANGTVPKKRKRAMSMNGEVFKEIELSNKEDNDGDVTEKSGEKSFKKVKFSMKRNLVWKPHSPLPPQSLRIPPSVTPRGSALKKGIPPGPIREVQVVVKKVKQRSGSLKKGKKGRKVVSPAKRLKKLQSFSI